MSDDNFTKEFIESNMSDGINDVEDDHFKDNLTLVDDYDDDNDDEEFKNLREINKNNIEYKKVKKEKNNNAFKVIITIVLIILLIGVGVGGYFLYTTDNPPKVKSVHIESDNFDDHSIAKYGNKITLSVSFDENLKEAPVIVIEGKQVEVFGDGRDYSAKYFVENQGSENKVVTFSIEEYKDIFFKKGEAIITTTDGSSVTIVGIK